MPCGALMAIINTLNWIQKQTSNQCSSGYRYSLFWSGSAHNCLGHDILYQLKFTDALQGQPHIEYIQEMIRKRVTKITAESPDPGTGELACNPKLRKGPSSQNCHLCIEQESWVQKDLEIVHRICWGSTILSSTRDGNFLDPPKPLSLAEVERPIVPKLQF